MNSKVLKDERLAQLANDFNVAQFLSFGPECGLRHAVTRHPVDSGSDARGLIAEFVSRVGSVNIRTFTDVTSKSTPFIYGIQSADEAASRVVSLAADGYHTILNETVDVDDGGVSGVALGGVTEFAPGTTPRGVEQEEFVARLPIWVAEKLLAAVYRFDVDLHSKASQRVEYSLHPLRVGVRNSHMLVWEVEEVSPVELSVQPFWPNAFSQFLGDKVYGLLVAHALGFRVPYSIVVGRNVAPFTFGTSTGTGEQWIRTSPRTADPGRYTTAKGWVDPWKLLAKEDPDGTLIPSLLCQESVNPYYSGASAVAPEETELPIEGVAGHGDAFMLGTEAPMQVPAGVADDVRGVLKELAGVLGSAEIEWVHDGTELWIVQLHVREHPRVSPGVLSPGDAQQWLSFDPRSGLDALRELVVVAAQKSAGIEVTRHVGVTSHVGDILRRARVPARLVSR